VGGGFGGGLSVCGDEEGGGPEKHLGFLGGANVRLRREEEGGGDSSRRKKSCGPLKSPGLRVDQKVPFLTPRPKKRVRFVEEKKMAGPLMGRPRRRDVTVPARAVERKALPGAE